MAQENAMDVFSLMDRIDSMKSEDIQKAAMVQAHKALVSASTALQANPWLIKPRVPDYVNGLEIKKGNHVYTVKDMVRMVTRTNRRPSANIGLVGPAGCGKTMTAYHIADCLNADIIRENQAVFEENKKLLTADKPLKDYAALPYPIWHVSCHEASRSEDFTVSTKVVVHNGEAAMEEIMGAALSAFTQGGVLIIEEYDMAPPGVWAEMHGIFEPSTEAVMFYANGPKQYIRHENFVVLATGNTRGRGENAVEFAGTQIQNAAFRSRFRWFPVSWLPNYVELNLLKDSGMREDVAVKMVRVAERIREAVNSDEFNVEMSTRDLKNWCNETLDLADEARFNSSTSIKDYWVGAVKPAAFPCFVWRMDDSDQVAVETYLDII